MKENFWTKVKNGITILFWRETWTIFLKNSAKWTSCAHAVWLEQFFFLFASSATMLYCKHLNACLRWMQQLSTLEFTFVSFSWILFTHLNGVAYTLWRAAVFLANVGSFESLKCPKMCKLQKWRVRSSVQKFKLDFVSINRQQNRVWKLTTDF